MVKEIIIPEDLTEISTAKVLALLSAEMEAENDQDRIDLVVSIACEVSEKVVAAMPLEYKVEIANEIGKALNKPLPVVESIHVDTKELKLITKWDSITYGEYISMDELARPTHKDDIKTHEDACYFMAVAYREYEGETIKRFTGGENPSDFINSNAAQYLYAVNQFFQLKKRIIEAHPTMQGQKGEGEADPLQSDWGWFGVTDSLANGDLLKHTEITELPVGVVMKKLEFNAQVKQRENLKRIKNGLRAI